MKVLGKKAYFKMLDSKLKRSWLLNGSMKIIEPADEFYLVHLSSIEDYKHALFEGPYKVADHYLIVQRWRPFFLVECSWILRLPLKLSLQKIS